MRRRLRRRLGRNLVRLQLRRLPLGRRRARRRRSSAWTRRTGSALPLAGRGAGSAARGLPRGGARRPLPVVSRRRRRRRRGSRGAPAAVAVEARARWPARSCRRCRRGNCGRGGRARGRRSCRLRRRLRLGRAGWVPGRARSTGWLLGLVRAQVDVGRLGDPLATRMPRLRRSRGSSGRRLHHACGHSTVRCRVRLRPSRSAHRRPVRVSGTVGGGASSRDARVGPFPAGRSSSRGSTVRSVPRCSSPGGRRLLLRAMPVRLGRRNGCSQGRSSGRAVGRRPGRSEEGRLQDASPGRRLARNVTHVM